jgi:hypothetical protein
MDFIKKKKEKLTSALHYTRRTTMISKATLSLLALLAAPVAAWPTGAGACPKGMPAVQGSHLSEDRDVITGSLEDAPQGLRIQLNGRPLRDGALLQVGESAEIKLVGDMPFKGFLIRLGQNEEEDTVAMLGRAGGYLPLALTPVKEDTSVKIEESYCGVEGVAGVTHTGKEEKTEVTAILEPPQALDYIMDVTVVIGNTAESSEYYHTSYIVRATDEPINPLSPWISPPVETYTYSNNGDASRVPEDGLEMEEEAVVEGVEDVPMAVASGSSSLSTLRMLTSVSVAMLASLFL